METLGQKKTRLPKGLGIKSSLGRTLGQKNSSMLPVNNGILAPSSSGLDIHTQRANSVDTQYMPTGLKQHREKTERSHLEKKHRRR
jgi:hypothetical protein